MNLEQFQNENNIIDPNLRRKQQGTQGNSRNVTPNQPRQKRVVTPQEMGFTHEEEPKLERPEDPILDRMDVAIARRQKETKMMIDAIEESGEDGLTEEEFQDILLQNKDILDDDSSIPTEEELSQNVNKTYSDPIIPQENPTSSLMDELEAELEEDEADAEYLQDYDEDNDTEEYYYNTPVSEIKAVSYNDPVGEPGVKGTDMSKNTDTKSEEYNPFKNFVSGNINFDEENEELDGNEDKSLAEKEQEEQIDKLRTLVRQKIKPVTNTFDISTFSISKRPASSSIATPRGNNTKIGDWVLMSSQKPIYMKKFTGTEIDRLQNGGKGRTRLNRALDTWQLIYDHIVDPHKPESMIEWSKVTSFLDIDHIYMAMYRANFEGTNYIPYTCDSCKEVILSDNFDIMDMCKFAKKEDKEKFDSILGSETNITSKLYSTEIIPVSDDYAFSFREPSIYNIIFESAVLDQDWVEKFGDLVTICTYIDEIYYINKEERCLQPIRTNVYPNNMKKTVKSRIINFSKIISTLDSDQYNTLIAYMQKINEAGESLTYQLPEITCPKCGTVKEPQVQDAQNLVFTRHQLAALATL